MRRWVTFASLAVLLLFAGTVRADWTETNKDGTPGGGLDYLDDWVAVFNGGDPGPATNWYTADYLSTWYGSDAGWYDNVVNITDADATAYAAINKYEPFTDVKASVSLSTADISEEFGVMVRASSFDWGNDITSVSAYAATFSADNALEDSDPTKFSLYKIVNGEIIEAKTQTANVLAGSFSDLITFIELSAYGTTVEARLFDDADSPSPLATLSFTDSSLSDGYTGVINLDLDSLGIGSYYDTLESIIIPEPAALSLLALGGLAVVRRRR